MRRQQPQDSRYDETDEHDAPTEPMMPIAIAPFLPTQAGSTAQPPRYPYLPPAQVKKNGHGGQRPPGGVPPSPASSASPTSPVYPVPSARPAKQAQPKRSPIPTLVGTFFVMVQLLLLMRFLLKLLSMPGNSGWVSIVYTVSGLFVFPFRLLLQNMALSLPVSVEVFTLLAILVYGLFSRILVRFLKALLNSR